MKETIETTPKKVWCDPELTLISKGYSINGGADPHYAEASITKSNPYVALPGHYQLFFGVFGTDIVTHKKSFYVS